jgi:predicted nucleic acid-binding protein
LKVTGLLGILLRAKQVGQIESLQPIIDDLINKAGFRIAPKLLAQILMQ